MDGVMGFEELTLKIGKKFKLDELFYFCTSHPDDMFHSFSITDKKRKGKDRVNSDALGMNNFQVNRSYREMADVDVGVSGDFDPCSNIV